MSSNSARRFGFAVRRRETVGAVEIREHPFLQHALEIEPRLRKSRGHRFDLLSLRLPCSAAGVVERVFEILGRQQHLAASKNGIRMLHHRDGEARVLRDAFAEPLQRAPALRIRQILAVNSGLKHVLEPSVLSTSIRSEDLARGRPIVLKQTRNRIDRLVTHHAFRRLHRGNFILGRNRSCVAHPRSEFEHIDAEEVLKHHPRP